MYPHTKHPTETARQGRYGRSLWRITWSGMIVAALGLALASPATVQAKTFKCKTGDVACLIASIKQANSQPGTAHEIRLAAGVYTLIAVENETNGPNGLPSITSRLTIRGAGNDVTVLEQQVNAQDFRLIYVASTGKLTLDGLTLRGAVSLFEGAGLYNNGGTVTITNTSFINNINLAGNGGGLYNNGGTVTITQSTIAKNNGFFGGGLYNTGVLSILNSTIVENMSFGGGGVASTGMLTMINSTVARNVAQGGGSIAGTNTMRILNSTIVENSDTMVCVGVGGAKARHNILYTGGE